MRKEKIQVEETGVYYWMTRKNNKVMKKTGREDRLINSGKYDR